ncbi:MAG: hypothetical protein JWM20_646 [Patescibacteria group bacterium]|nr:hypothetical protein [Patescibacteria group bacterium]
MIVVRKGKKKFFAITIDRKKSSYDNALYFETLGAPNLKEGAEVKVYRKEEIIDSCQIGIFRYSPGQGPDEEMKQFMFESLKTGNERSGIQAAKWEVGDRVVFEWELNDEECNEIKDLPNVKENHRISPDLVHMLFIGRVALASKSFGVLQTYFTLFFQTI